MLFWKFIWHSTNWKSIYFLSKMHIRDTYKNFAAIHISEDCSKGAFTNYVYKRKGVGGQKNPLFVNFYTMENVNGGG